MTWNNAGVLVRMPPVVVGLLLLTACSDDAMSPGDGRFSTPLPIAMSDTIACPANSSGLTVCSVLPQDSVNILKDQAQRALDGTTGACRDAGVAIMGALNGPVYMHHHPSSGLNAVLNWLENPSPPHDPNWLIVAQSRFSQTNLAEGNTLTTLFHEGGHLLGIEHNSDPNNYTFALDCLDQLVEEEEVEQPAEGGGGGGGDEECDESNPCDDGPSTCVVRIWYWKDTLQVISTTILYCY